MSDPPVPLTDEQPHRRPSGGEAVGHEAGHLRVVSDGVQAHRGDATGAAIEVQPSVVHGREDEPVDLAGGQRVAAIAAIDEMHVLALV